MKPRLPPSIYCCREIPNATITMGTIKNMVGAHDLVLNIHLSGTVRYPIH